MSIVSGEESVHVFKEIGRLRPEKMNEYYEPMMGVLSNVSSTPEIVTEFVILSMPRAGDILRHLFYSGQSNAPATIGRTIQLLSLLPSY